MAEPAKLPGIIGTADEWMRTLLFLPDARSTYATDVDRLHFFVISTTIVASTIIGLVALYFFARYRRRSDTDRTPHIEPTVSYEVVVIGVPLALFLLWFVIGFRQYMHMETPPPGAMDVYVMGKQWMWKFSHTEGPSEVETLHVPVHRPIRLLITSRDVIHSFFVPAFRMKKDAIPGRYTQTWFEATATGRYPIFCAEYCGVAHSYMRGEVVVMEQSEYDRWLAASRESTLPARTDGENQQQPVGASMVDEGRRVASEVGCFRCHTVDGSPYIGPTWLGLYGRSEKLASGQTVVVDEAYMTESMMDPLAKVVEGFKPVMPTFQGRLDGPQSAAIVEFIKSLHADRVETGPSEKQTYEPSPSP
jgi:cytochrome c oxidase subunit 2